MRLIPSRVDQTFYPTLRAGGREGVIQKMIVVLCLFLLLCVGQPDTIASGGTNMSDTYLTPEQAAEMLNLSAYTIRAYARQGIIPAHKIGRTWRFSKADLDDWVLSDGRSPSLERRDVVIARDRASSAMFSPIPAATSGYGEADAVNERSRAIRTLRDIRARTRKGSATALIRDSRKELQDRGHIDRSDA